MQSHKKRKSTMKTKVSKRRSPKRKSIKVSKKRSPKRKSIKRRFSRRKSIKSTRKSNEDGGFLTWISSFFGYRNRSVMPVNDTRIRTRLNEPNESLISSIDNRQIVSTPPTVTSGNNPLIERNESDYENVISSSRT